MTEPLDVYNIKERRRIEERRKLVALPANMNMSNRALAKEMGISEGTVRGDRKWLALPADQRPLAAAKVPATPKITIKTKKPYDPSNAEQHRKLMLAAAKQWIEQVGVVLADVEEIVAETARTLYSNRQETANLPRPSKSPEELLSDVRPRREVEDYMPDKLYFLRDWLARWLACCLPRQEEAQDEMLRQVLRLAKMK